MQPTLTLVELKEATDVFRRLKRNDPADRIAGFLVPLLGPDTVSLLDSYRADLNPGLDLVAAMLPDLNAVIEGPSIWDRDRFSDVEVTAPTRRLLRKRFSRDDQVLNRLLLQDAFPLFLEDKENSSKGRRIGKAMSGIPFFHASFRAMFRKIEALAEVGAGTESEVWLGQFVSRVHNSGFLALLANIEKTQQALVSVPPGPNDRRDLMVADMQKARQLAAGFYAEVKIGRTQRRVKSEVPGEPDKDFYPRLSGCTELDAFHKRVLNGLARAIEENEPDLDALM